MKGGGCEDSDTGKRIGRELGKAHVTGCGRMTAKYKGREASDRARALEGCGNEGRHSWQLLYDGEAKSSRGNWRQKGVVGRICSWAGVKALN